MKWDNQPGKHAAKWLPSVVIFLLPLAPLCCLGLRSPHGPEELLSPGPLIRGHQNLTCRTCHAEAWRGVNKMVSADTGRTTGMDKACAGCHGGLSVGQGEAPSVALLTELVARPGVVRSHNDRQILADVDHCANCHQEHEKGRITYAADSDCSRCHENLRSRDGAPTLFARHITAFDRDHPPFGQWRPDGLSDPGEIHFNHYVHLNLPVTGDERRSAPSKRWRMQGCFSCHERDQAGRYFLSISYPKHCADCHPLSVQLVLGRSDPRAKEAALLFGRDPAPHVETSTIRQVMRDRLLGLVASFPDLLEPASQPPLRPFPGRRPPGPKEFRPWVDEQLKQTGRQLYAQAGGCGKCHLEEVPDQGPGLPRYKPTNMLRRWFPNARYSHAKHDLMACLQCHDVTTSTRTSDVLMPTIETCVRCHNRGKDGGLSARADCVLCHSYHTQKAE
jgi:predicted CXXCH cytochrome family protein